MRRVADVEAEPINWLWPGRFPAGKLSLIAGEPGLGKSQLACSIAATVSVGGMWPLDEGFASVGSAIILSAEDDVADTIRPRLEVAGANLQRVHVISAVKQSGTKGHRQFSLQHDLAKLEVAIRQVGDTQLVIVDPISSYVGNIDSHNEAQVRGILEPISEMVARNGVAAIATAHLSKSYSAQANKRVMGSVAFVGVARAISMVMQDPEDKDGRLLLPTKSNLGPRSSGLSFGFDAVQLSRGIAAPKIVWRGFSKMVAEEVFALASGMPDGGRLREAEIFLREQLSEGPKSTRAIMDEAKVSGFSEATIRRAHDRLGVLSTKKAFEGGWVWSLPG